MREARRTLDLVLNTIPTKHDYDVYTRLVANYGKHVIMGLHSGLAAALVVNGIVCNSSKVVPSMIGGIPYTQSLVDLCDKVRSLD